MRDGFIRVAASTPSVRVADTRYNAKKVCDLIREGIARGAAVMVFPELCLTAYTCGDLFCQDVLLRRAKDALKETARATEQGDVLVFVGLPWERDGKLYNVAAALYRGRLLGLIPKVNIPNYSEFYEKRYFEPGNRVPVMVKWEGQEVPMGSNLLFCCQNMPGFTVAAEICEDVWSPRPPSVGHALAGATVLVNCSASNESTGKDAYRRDLITGQSARLVCGYVYANAGEGESTQDLVFGGHNLIAEDGVCLAESKRFVNETVYADIDLDRLGSERRRMTTFCPEGGTEYIKIPFSAPEFCLPLERRVSPHPFVPDDEDRRRSRCEEILSIQAMGLKKRMEHTGLTSAVIGLSGGLDSTLALLVIARVFDLMGLPRNQIWALTMPCFGTTGRTYENACSMAEKLGASLKEIDIRESVTLHFRDIGQPDGAKDVAYENSQARERTQVLMDFANRVGGLVVGTGDMSELALGWATYNGDHMSMYGVNASVPKTLVRHLVKYCASTSVESGLKEVLCDVLDTPVSPELLPPEDGLISQKTEDLVGPYELHDFFLYYVLRFGYEPAKIYHLALHAFCGQYEGQVILKWLKTFYRRFFSQQFKRSCLPDGPKVGSVAVSPRGDLRMPSDACAEIWLKELEKLGED